MDAGSLTRDILTFTPQIVEHQLYSLSELVNNPDSINYKNDIFLVDIDATIIDTDISLTNGLSGLITKRLLPGASKLLESAENLFIVTNMGNNRLVRFLKQHQKTESILGEYLTNGRIYWYMDRQNPESIFPVFRDMELYNTLVDNVYQALVRKHSTQIHLIADDSRWRNTFSKFLGASENNFLLSINRTLNSMGLDTSKLVFNNFVIKR